MTEQSKYLYEQNKSVIEDNSKLTNDVYRLRMSIKQLKEEIEQLNKERDELREAFNCIADVGIQQLQTIQDKAFYLNFNKCIKLCEKGKAKILRYKSELLNNKASF